MESAQPSARHAFFEKYDLGSHFVWDQESLERKTNSPRGPHRFWMEYFTREMLTLQRTAFVLPNLREAHILIAWSEQSHWERLSAVKSQDFTPESAD